MEYEEGDTYKGHFFNDQFHGKGTHSWCSATPTAPQKSSHHGDEVRQRRNGL